MTGRSSGALLTVTVILVLFLTGCSGEEKSSDASLTKVLEKGELVLGFDAEFPPMGFIDEDGNYTGFDLDLAKEVCARLGVTLTPHPINWEDKEKDLNEGRIDCIWNGLSVNSERQESMNLSDSYMENELIFVVNKGSSFKTVDDLKGKKVGTQSGSSTETALEESEIYPDINVVKAGDNVELFSMMENNEIDSVFLDSIFAYYYIAENNKDYYVLPSVMDTEEIAIGFRKGDQALRDEVQKKLSEMKADGTLAKISEKWFGTDVTIIK